MFRKLLGSAAVLTLLAGPAAADGIKIGFVTTLTTPAAVIGKDMRDAVDLAVETLGGKMAGKDFEIVYADDEFNSQKGKQATERIVLRENVDIVAGYIWSNVLLASAPVVLGADKILISANAGPSPLAGAQCNKNFFNIAWQNDQTPMALGE
ncbi:MAG: ABC transporter substrate-binding protein, partial [Alphaproteobacteria bacterium]